MANAPHDRCPYIIPMAPKNTAINRSNRHLAGQHDGDAWRDGAVAATFESVLSTKYSHRQGNNVPQSATIIEDDARDLRQRNRATRSLNAWQLFNSASSILVYRLILHNCGEPRLAFDISRTPKGNVIENLGGLRYRRHSRRASRVRRTSPSSRNPHSKPCFRSSNQRRQLTSIENTQRLHDLVRPIAK